MPILFHNIFTPFYFFTLSKMFPFIFSLSILKYLKPSFQMFLLFLAYSNHIYLMILPVVFLGIVVLGAVWIFGLRALWLFFLFLSSFSSWANLTLQVVGLLLDPEAEPGHCREGPLEMRQFIDSVTEGLRGLFQAALAYECVSLFPRSAVSQKSWCQATVSSRNLELYCSSKGSTLAFVSATN